ncbi:hypothetical protein SDC9_161935 [bioreactor metagenome]|uniref:Uncharacterized protein n=1 Tax=bioreactor metagenome TaxID=1076179 RepID=A0A645FJM6_9ZZZZ
MEKIGRLPFTEPNDLYYIKNNKRPYEFILYVSNKLKDKKIIHVKIVCIQMRIRLLLFK